MYFGFGSESLWVFWRAYVLCEVAGRGGWFGYGLCAQVLKFEFSRCGLYNIAV